jgi:hypothetical protein
LLLRLIGTYRRPTNKKDAGDSGRTDAIGSCGSSFPWAFDQADFGQEDIGQETISSCSPIVTEGEITYFDTTGYCLLVLDQDGNYKMMLEDGNVTLNSCNLASEYLAAVAEDQPYFSGVHFESWDWVTFQDEAVAPGVLLYSFEFVPENQEHKPTKVVKKALSQGGGS